MNIGHYREYCEENFEAHQWSEKIRDKRKRPEIPTVQIFQSILETPMLGQKNLLELDGFLRTPEARKWHGSERLMVASDTTIQRVTEGMNRQSVQEVGYEVIDKADEQALWDLLLPSGKKLRFGIVDGHWAGGRSGRACSLFLERLMGWWIWNDTRAAAMSLKPAGRY